MHRLFLNLSLHGLGYDNARHTGEEWFIKNILAKADIQIAIDVGANVGHYSKFLVKYLPAVVYAIEPSSSSFKELANAATKHQGKILPINAAIADKDGVGVLYSRHELSEKATLSPDLGDSSAIQESVQIKTLDSLVAELVLTRVDFIKIDTEGHELEVFKGMQQTLVQLKPKYIQFEFNHVHLYKGTSLFQLSTLLADYQFYRLLPHGWMRIDPTKQSSNIYMFSNIIAKRK